MARAMRASVPSPLSSTYRFNYSPLPSPPAWLFGPHHSPQSKPVFIKLLWNVGKADTEEVGVYLGGAKYFIAPSIALCDWVVYAVNAGDKPWATGCSLSLRDGPWQKKKKKKPILSAPSMRRPTGKMPGMPDYQSSPDHILVLVMFKGTVHPKMKICWILLAFRPPRSVCFFIRFGEM